ncbi:TPA: hypothetical protein EYP70_04665 [Candidatus Bathyarchaeota archaeon]|nr:hypothetical protein [Candidatus Bathyarchaeota archaeon]
MEELIGVSLISLVECSVDEGVKLIRDEDFNVIEIFVGTPGIGTVGFPEPLPTPLIHPDHTSVTEIRKLRRALKDFELVTMHVQIKGVNIASLNTGIRRESVRQYMKCFDLAANLDASILTFHPGNPGLDYPHYREAFSELGEKANFEFAEKALDKAKSIGIKSGFEGPHGAGWPVVNLTLKLHDETFGVLVDIAQGLMGYKLNHQALINDIIRCKGLIPEVHVHGILKRAIGIAGHLPLRMNNVVNFPLVLKALKEAFFEGPYIFEITPSEKPKEVIRECLDSKIRLLHLLQKSI